MLKTLLLSGIASRVSDCHTYPRPSMKHRMRRTLGKRCDTLDRAWDRAGTADQALHVFSSAAHAIRWLNLGGLTSSYGARSSDRDDAAPNQLAIGSDQAQGQAFACSDPKDIPWSTSSSV
jgi:hypothetical protein